MAEPSVKVSLDRDKIEMGEIADLDVEFSWKRVEGAYQFELPEIQTSNLTLRKQSTSQENFFQGGEEWVKRTYRIEVEGKAVGEAAIEEFRIPYYINPEMALGNFMISSQKLTVRQSNSNSSAILMLGAAIVFAGFITLIFLRSRRINAKSKTPLEGEVTPEDKTLIGLNETWRCLDDLKAHDVLSKFAKYLREYIKRFYQMPLAGMTDAEMIGVLKTRGISREEMATLERLFNRLEEMKYSSEIINQNDMHEIHQSICSYIKSKKIVEATR